MKLEDLTPKQRLKAEKWLAIIRECINSDLSNEVWCEQNNVSIKSYYYYLAKLRKKEKESSAYRTRMAGKRCKSQKYETESTH